MAAILKRRTRVWLTFVNVVLCVFVLISSASHPAFCQQPPNASTPVASTPSGQAIFSQRCSRCHGETGDGVSGLVTIAGPSLKAEHDEGRVMLAIETGPNHMPEFSYILPVPEIRSVADYVTQQIAVIPLTGGNLSEGGELFRTKCAACHRTAVRGGALAFTGTNAPALTDKSAALIAGAIRWGPGAMPAFPASILNDQQLASVVEYVKFVQHPPSPGGNALRYIGPVSEGFIGWSALFLLVFISVWIERGGRG